MRAKGKCAFNSRVTQKQLYQKVEAIKCGDQNNLFNLRLERKERNVKSDFDKRKIAIMKSLFNYNYIRFLFERVYFCTPTPRL